VTAESQGRLVVARDSF